MTSPVAEETRPFLAFTVDPTDAPDLSDDVSEREFSGNCRLLYVSHFLSTWNSRWFEFGAVLFLISLYPNTLLPVSVYALARAASGALFSPQVGRYIDGKNRLHVVRLSIVSQRLAVATSCVIIFMMATIHSIQEQAIWSASSLTLLAVIACVEKLGAVMNTIAVERDWVVVIASSNDERLGMLNSRMRRIDLFCKLLGPLAIAFIDGASTKIAVLITGGMTVLSVPVEYWAIARVYRRVDALQPGNGVESTTVRSSWGVWPWITTAVSDMRRYCRHRAFLPSFALALLYLTVLSFSGQMVAYLASRSIPSGLIGALRGVAAVFELSSTWLAPRVINRIGSVRAGIWFINWQLICVTICSVFLWTSTQSGLAVAGVVVPVIASRVGLWGFDLSVQNIIQEEVEAPSRGSFSAQEFALQNVFEMLSFASTVVFSRPDQFKFPATISAGSVAIAGVLFAAFVRSRRGHLLHLSRCIDPHGFKHRNHQHWWMRSEGFQDRPQVQVE